MVAAPSPLDLLAVPFLREALAELVLVAVAGGLLGAFVVLRGLAFFSHGTGTAAFPGLVLADAAHVSPRLGALALALGYAGGVERTGRRSREATDVATALVLVGALAAGVLLASDVVEDGVSVDGLLFGSVLAVSTGDLAIAAAAAVLAALAVLTLGRAWTALAFDPESVNVVPARGLERLLLAAIAVVVVAAIPALGALLVTTLVVVPAAAARLLSTSVPRLVGLSVALAAGEAAAGLYLAWWADVPPGPAIAVLGASVYALTVLIAPRREGPS